MTGHDTMEWHHAVAGNRFSRCLHTPARNTTADQCISPLTLSLPSSFLSLLFSFDVTFPYLPLNAHKERRARQGTGWLASNVEPNARARSMRQKTGGQWRGKKRKRQASDLTMVTAAAVAAGGGSERREPLPARVAVTGREKHECCCCCC